MWARDEFLCFPGAFSKYVVHGHTPTLLLPRSPEVRESRCNLDTGAFLAGPSRRRSSTTPKPNRFIRSASHDRPLAPPSSASPFARTIMSGSRGRMAQISEERTANAKGQMIRPRLWSRSNEGVASALRKFLFSETALPKSIPSYPSFPTRRFWQCLIRLGRPRNILGAGRTRTLAVLWETRVTWDTFQSCGCG